MMYSPITLGSIFLSSLILNFLMIRYGHFFYLGGSPSKQVQDIHSGFVSRLGGLVLVVVFFLVEVIFLKNLYLFYYFVAIILVPALLEDLGYLIKPLYRFLFILLGCFLIVVLCIDIYPQFDFGVLNVIANNHFFQILFFTFALATVINGQNIIDGTNGLSAFTSLVIYSSLLYLGFFLKNEMLISQSILIIILLISFLLLNFPFGKIFLGDLGSYFLGLYAGYLVIDVYGKNPELSTWSAVIILFYPTLEVLFSYFRKLKDGISPFQPDKNHLHLKLFFVISKGSPKRQLYNALIAPFLSIIWLTPFPIFILALHFSHFSFLALFFLLLLYLFFYYAIPDVK